MNIFIAGGSGVIGCALIPLLVEAGYRVTAMSRTAAKLEELEMIGSTPVLGDVFDRQRLNRVLQKAEPDVVIHQLTSLGASTPDPFVETNRLRTEGTANLIHAARMAGAKRFIAQSVSFLCRSTDNELTNEETPLYLSAPEAFRAIVIALAELERQVLTIEDMEGIVLRYGHFYGDKTFYALDGAIATSVRQGQFPIVGNGQGIYSFVHIEDAARATVQAVTQGAPGIYTIVDDTPVPLHEWLPIYAHLLNAPQPEILPVASDPFSLYLMTQQQGALNHKAKQVLDWQPRYGSWHDGFKAMLS